MRQKKAAITLMKIGPPVSEVSLLLSRITRPAASSCVLSLTLRMSGAGNAAEKGGHYADEDWPLAAGPRTGLSLTLRMSTAAAFSRAAAS